ncbi:MAG TPA: hypothetical protein VMF68_02400 [Spirochaetia bacterium]|nr:hypothetical protein [Spirochaetia bacterium]
MWITEEPAVWRLRLEGRVEADWSRWFNWASVRCVACPDGGWQTVAEGELRDGAAIDGLMEWVRDMDTRVLSLDRISDPTRSEDMLAETIETWR